MVLFHRYVSLPEGSCIDWQPISHRISEVGMDHRDQNLSILEKTSGIPWFFCQRKLQGGKSEAATSSDTEVSGNDGNLARWTIGKSSRTNAGWISYEYVWVMSE